MSTCDVCKLSLTDNGYSNGTTKMVGLSIKVSDQQPEGSDPVKLRHYSVDKTYNVCFDCLLKAMGITPEK